MELYITDTLNLEVNSIITDNSIGKREDRK